MAADTNGIEVEGLVREFKDVVAVDGIDLSVAPGEIYGFLGPNGAGKSTTVHMLTTLLPPTAGQGDGRRLRRGQERSRRSTGDRRCPPGGGARPAPHRARPHASPDRAARDPAARARAARRRAARARRPLARRRPPRAHVLRRDEAPPRPRAGARPPPADPLPRRADHRPRPAEPQRALGRGRPAREGGGRDRLPDDAVPGGGRRARRPGRDHRPRPHRRRGDADRAEGRDRPADGRDHARRPRAARSTSRTSCAASASSSRSRRTASRCGCAHGDLDLAEIIRALDAESLHIANLQLHAPSLDDVFLEKTGRTLEGAAAEADAEAEPARR